MEMDGDAEGQGEKKSGTARGRRLPYTVENKEGKTRRLSAGKDETEGWNKKEIKPHLVFLRSA